MCSLALFACCAVIVPAQPIPNPDFIISIELEGVIHKVRASDEDERTSGRSSARISLPLQPSLTRSLAPLVSLLQVFVRKRPGVDHFLRMTALKFELVIFTASLAKYADPLLDVLDPDRLISSRLFRESCVQHYGNFVKDLTHLGRNMSHTLIIDNSPFSYLFQPTHAVPCTSWFNDNCDLQLFEMLPFLDRVAECEDVVALIAQEKAACCHTFFGNALKQPSVYVPTWQQQQQMAKQKAPLQHHQLEQRDPHYIAAGGELSQIQVAVSM